MASTYEGQTGSINEPPGSKVVPDGVGQGTGAPKTIRLDKLQPDQLPVGPTPDFILTVHGLQFDKDCKIVFHDQELADTKLKGDKLEARAPMSPVPVTVAVRVKKKDEVSNKLEFKFEAVSRASDDNERDPHDHRGGSDRDDPSSRNRRR